MKILSIETSCDETSAAVVENKDNFIRVLSNITATSLDIHATTGGIIPENAARMQVKYILPVIYKSLLESKTNDKELVDHNSFTLSSGSKIIDKSDIEMGNEILKNEIDAIAVTYGPGLIGSLLVGVETAKTLSMFFEKPIIKINHLLAHVFANFINRKTHEIKFPFIGLIVSGGHTDILLFENSTNYKWLGGTRDDAAGEALDKIGRLLNFRYPAGPEIEKRAYLVTDPQIQFKSPLINSDDFDFSFSGLKTEVLRFVNSNKIDTNSKNQVCYAVQKAVFDVLIKKTLLASQKFDAKMILVGGGVSANQTFRDKFSSLSQLPVLFTERQYSTDNAAMIGAYGLINPELVKWQDVLANPELYFA